MAGGAGLRIIVFRVLFGVGSALLVLALLISQAPTDDYTPDKIIYSAAGILLGTSLVLGRFRRGAGQWRAGSIPTLILSAEMVLCMYGLASVLTYRRH
jgi:hypothetical protein